MTSFFSLGYSELEKILCEGGFDRYRAKQIWECVYDKKIFSAHDMKVLPKILRDFISENFSFSVAKLLAEKRAGDDTGKVLFELRDGYFIESVLLEAPDEDSIRKTLCISTQVGCAFGCKFCASTIEGFKRDLSYDEIISQLLPFVKKDKFEFENIVVMGMGEPLSNYNNVMKALEIINKNFKFGVRRVTLSTCGLADKILKLVDDKFPFRLAISLHGASDDVREKIMPINKKFPLEELIKSAKKFSEVCGRMITLEYILIDSVNDRKEDAKNLAGIAKDLHAHVNLIPYNTVDILSWKRPSKSRCNEFVKILKGLGVSATLRREKGEEIDAACGQLVLRSKLYSLE